MSKLAIVLLSLLGLWALAGCPAGSDSEPGTDGPVAGDQGQKDAAVPDAPKEPDLPPMTSYKVAAVQYASGQYGQVQGCTDDICALSKLAEQAAKAGARLVVTPEYAVAQQYSEPTPKVGDNPVVDSRWEEGSIIKSLAKAADDLNITFVFHVFTDEGDDNLYSAGVAVDRYGVVVARHYKFQPYGEKGLTPGTNLNTSFFDTPAGKAGILICADVQCAVVGVVSTYCSANAMGLMQSFIAQKPDLIVFSSHWMVGPTNAGGSNWWPINVQKTMAKTAKAYVVGANVSEGPGAGGGIINPDGTEIATVTSTKPTVVYGDLPLKK